MADRARMSRPLSDAQRMHTHGQKRNSLTGQNFVRFLEVINRCAAILGAQAWRFKLVRRPAMFGAA